MSVHAFTHLAVAGLAAVLAWQFQGARLGADLAEARAHALDEKLAISTAQRAADARVRQAELSITTKYQGALNDALKKQSALQAVTLALAASVTACASNCPMLSSDLPTLPRPPSSTTAEPSTSYSDSAASDTQRWQQRLMGTLLMQQPAAPPGP